MDFTNSNRAMRQMLQLWMQRMMGEESLERQKEYVDYSSDVYGKRQRENLEATEASRLRVGEQEHAWTMEEKAYSLMSDLSKTEPIKQLKARYFMEQDPAKKEAIAADLASYGTLIGNMFDLGQNGEPVPAGMYEEASKYLSQDQLQKVFDGTRQRMGQREQWVNSAANRAQMETSAARTAGLQERRLGLDTKKYELAVEKQKGMAAPGAVPEKAKFPAVVAAADKAQAALLKAMDLGEGEEGDMARIQEEVAKIRNRGIVGGWPNRTALDRDMTFLEKIYNPTKAAESLRARDWVAEQDAARAASRAPATTPTTPAVDQVSELTVKLIARGVPKDIARQMAEEYFRGR